MAIRQPVYLEKDDTGSFWGFSIVICDMDDVLHQAAFESIDRMGYKYRLTAVVDNEEVFVSGLKGENRRSNSRTDHLRETVASHNVSQGEHYGSAFLLGLYGNDVPDRSPCLCPGQPEQGTHFPQ